MQLTFNIPNTELAKKRALQSTGRKWRDFKSNLTEMFIKLGMSDEEILKKYDHITKEVWAEFKAKRMTDDWKVR